MSSASWVAGDFAAQPVQHPARIALGIEEDRSMVIVNPGNAKSLAREENRYLGPGQAARTGYPMRMRFCAKTCSMF
jgi:hypothetical protein